MSRKRQNARNSGRFETRSLIRRFVAQPLLRLGPATAAGARQILRRIDSVAEPLVAERHLPLAERQPFKEHDPQREPIAEAAQPTA
jgi:hypothetical protein